jgi:hypothetical protein
MELCPAEPCSAHVIRWVSWPFLGMEMVQHQPPSQTAGELCGQISNKKSHARFSTGWPVGTFLAFLITNKTRKVDGHFAYHFWVSVQAHFVQSFFASLNASPLKVCFSIQQQRVGLARLSLMSKERGGDAIHTKMRELYDGLGAHKECWLIMAGLLVVK